MDSQISVWIVKEYQEFKPEWMNTNTLKSTLNTLVSTKDCIMM